MPLLKIQRAARIALKDYMGLEESETLLVIGDPKMREIALAIYESGIIISKEAFYIEMRERELNGEEPPEQIADLMKAVDVVIAVTTKSLTHTNARRNASKIGVRVGTMPGITLETMIRCLNGNIDKVLDITQRVQDAFQNVSKVKVLAKHGTNVTFDVTGRKSIASTGVLRNIGDSGNLPSGEVYIAPIENSVNGIIAFDASIATLGVLTHPVYVEVQNGIAKKISGRGGDARLFGKLVNRYGEKSKTVGEFGIGTNPYAKICGEILEDEKVLGTVHFAFGNNLSFGGTNDVSFHVDGLISKPTVYFDDKIIMEDGKLLL